MFKNAQLLCFNLFLIHILRGTGYLSKKLLLSAVFYYNYKQVQLAASTEVWVRIPHLFIMNSAEKLHLWRETCQLEMDGAGPWQKRKNENRPVSLITII